jgi:hypothetical protein
MKRIRESRTSPAFAVAVLALVAAVVGTAVAADPFAGTAVSKKKTKKIAAKEAARYFDANIGGASVANAATAGRAARAGSATTSDAATTAGALSTQRRINYQAAPPSASQQILSLGSLRLSASCAAGPNVAVTARTTVDNATLQSDTPTSISDLDFDTTETLQLSTVSEQRPVVYTAPGGQVIVIQHAVVRNSILYGGGPGCFVKGVAQILSG